MPSNKKISAQSQVNNKVNAGIMDNIALGEIGENISPDFTIGMEMGSNLEYGHVASGSAAPPINESTIDKENYQKYMKLILKYFENDCNLPVKPYPKVRISNDAQDGLFIKTGYYNPIDKEIVLFSKDRHPKDVLRSFAHELIHHSQNIRGENLSFSSSDNVYQNKELEKLEKEAYLLGNIFFRKWTEQYQQSLNESIEKNISKYEPANIDLKSFDIKKHLNPKFWKDGHLDSRIRLKLFDIADEFINTLDMPWLSPSDIIITGSIANFNWNKKYSDIDLHIVYDFKDIDKNVAIVKNYFDAKKKVWNETHKNISIYGFPIEIYVQDVNEVHYSNGIYSVDSDKWLKEPSKENMENAIHNLFDEKAKKRIKNKVSSYIKKIDFYYDKFKKIDKLKSDFYYKRIYGKIENLFKKIKSERSSSLNLYKNEYSEGNIIFKSLRRLGYIAKLIKLKNLAYDRMQSIF